MADMLTMRRSLLCTAVALFVAFAGELNAQNAPTITASTISLAFAWTQGAALPAAQTVSVRVSAGTPAYTLATPAQNQWLLATSPIATLPASVTVQVNPSTLTPGIYVSTVTITATGIASPLVIAITLTVSSPSAGIVIAPATVPLSSPGTLTGTFTVTAGSLPATFTTTSGTPWLAVSTTAGALLPAQSETITVTANSAGLVPAATPYAGKITLVTSSNGVSKTQTVVVNLTVNPLMPVVSSVWPAQIPVGSPDTEITVRGANYYAATTVTASGSATALKTTVVGGSALQVIVPAALLAVAGTVNLTVTNPAPGGPAAPVGITVGNVSTITGITNAASSLPGAISPGDIIAIYGQNIGPAAPAQMNIVGGFAQTSVGNVTITIDGQAAPSIYASSSQVNVQVPYTVTQGTAAQGKAKAVVLTSGSATPAQTNVDIVPAVPGIFTLNASGAGPALVLDFNAVNGAFSINSSTNPAAIGSTVVLFLTGEGDYASSVYSTETGFIVPLTPPVATGVYPQLSPLPVVTIGGVAATVNYAGPIPGCILGLLQLNVVVPVGSSTGNAVPLVVSVGAVQAQANVTMAIH